MTKKCQKNMMKNDKNSEKLLKNRKFNKVAIYSCICSIISWFIFWWLGAAGIGLGIRALNEIKTKEEKGKILAIVGIVVGTIELGLYFYVRIKSI
jgi:hypothetical protein